MNVPRRVSRVGKITKIEVRPVRIKNSQQRPMNDWFLIPQIKAGAETDEVGTRVNGGHIRAGFTIGSNGPRMIIEPKFEMAARRRVNPPPENQLTKERREKVDRIKRWHDLPFVGRRVGAALLLR
ncbi:MAG: hypothetical protein K2X25_11535 [Caulobacteraceae bacterium]|nr:hypothetical protein [Caulobacteraceae bacterium]